MSPFPLCLAEAGWFSNFMRSLSSSITPTLQQTVVFLFLFLVVGLIFVWAVFFRTKGHQHRRHHRHHKAPAAPAPAPAGQVPFRPPHHHRRRRRRHHTEFRRNPTLAETGGLPPRRDEGVPPPHIP
jgi:hypothetical protein